MDSKALRAKLDEMGVSFGECVEAFEEPWEEATLDRAEYHRLVSDGTLEISRPGIVSRGDDKGAYVMAWLWVEDLESEEDDNDDE